MARRPSHAVARAATTLALVAMALAAPVPALASELGDDIAWLAVRVAATADPDPAISILGTPASPTGAWYRLDDPRLANEYAVYDATLARQGGSTAYASCTQAVCAVLGCTMDLRTCTLGVSRNSQTFMDYIPTQPSLYREVTGCGMDGLEPGDILCNDWHTAIYVGNAAARERFPKTGGNVYEAHYFGGKYPAISTYGSTDGFRVFRPVARRQGDAFPDYEALVGERRHVAKASQAPATPTTPAPSPAQAPAVQADEGGVTRVEQPAEPEQPSAQGMLSASVTSSDPASTSDDDAYSLGGATIGVFSDEGLTDEVTTLSTGPDGTTPPVTLDVGTYWTSVTGAPSGFVGDATPREVAVTDGGGASVEVTLAPVMGEASGAVSLVDADTGDGSPQGSASLAGAVVTLARDGSGQIVKGTTDDMGRVTLDAPLPIGTWRVRVAADPVGYVAGDTSDAAVTVSPDGSVSGTKVACEAVRSALDVPGSGMREWAAGLLAGTDGPIRGGRLAVANVSQGVVVRDGVAYPPGTAVYDGSPALLELPRGTYRVSVSPSDVAVAFGVGDSTFVVEVG